MGAKSKIEWTDATWTPVRAQRKDTGNVGVHCEKVSPACKNCYAERLNERNLPSHGTGMSFTILNRDKVNIFVDDDMVMQPIKWKRPRRIFVCSQTDLLGDFVDDYEIAQVFAVMALAHWHTFQVLTKRIERAHSLLSSENFWELVDSIMAVIVDGEVDPLERQRDDLRATAPEVGPSDPLKNVWIGVTAENQEWADKRIPHLLQTPAAKRFVSCEPLLERVSLDRALLVCASWWTADSLPNGGMPNDLSKVRYKPQALRGINQKTIDWVIAGGESGPGARPSHPDWFRLLRNQCEAAKVPFFFKQWGEFADLTNEPDESRAHKSSTQDLIFLPDGEVVGAGYRQGKKTQGMVDSRWRENGGAWMGRIGKKAAGRLLDGREWNEAPA